MRHDMHSAGLLPTLLILSTACTVDDLAAPHAGSAFSVNGRAAGPTVQHIATTPVPVLTSSGGVTVFKSGHGSAMALLPGSSRNLYLLTDRGQHAGDRADARRRRHQPRPVWARFGGTRGTH